MKNKISNYKNQIPNSKFRGLGAWDLGLGTYRNVLQFFFLLLFFASCSKNIHKQTTKELVIFPSPPDPTRIQYLTSISNSRSVTRGRSAFLKFIAGDVEPLPIIKPNSIAIYKGKLYITDVGVGGFEVINLDKKTFNYFSPKGKGQFKLPLNCFIDEKNGNLYVADVERHQVVIFDSTNNYLNSIGELDDTTKIFKPTDVCVFGNKIWVTDVKGNKVNVYDKVSLKLLFSFPQADPNEEKYLFQPTSIFVTDKKVYVTDFGDFKIKIYSHDGKFLSSVGGYGKTIGQFVRPKGIAVDREDNLYVVDAGFENIQIFNKDGKLLLFFGGPYTGPGYMWLPSKVLIDYDNLKFFQKYVDPSFTLKYLIFVVNRYGPDKVSVYGFVEPMKIIVGVSDLKKNNSVQTKAEEKTKPITLASTEMEQPKIKATEFPIVNSKTEEIPDTTEIKKEEPLLTTSTDAVNPSPPPAEISVNNSTSSVPTVSAPPPATIVAPTTAVVPLATDNIIFRIQIAASHNPLPPNNIAFKNISEKIDNEKCDDGWIRYYTGSFKNSEEAASFLNELKSKGGNGVVVAFKDGKKISLLEAKKLSEQK